MEEIVSYFEKLEKRLSALEAAEAKEAEQEELIEALKRRVLELQTLTTALSARNIQLENRLSALETQTQQLQESVETQTQQLQESVKAQMQQLSVCPPAEPEEDSDEIKLDEETGLPELEVEFVDEPEEETTEETKEAYIEKELKVIEIPQENAIEEVPMSNVSFEEHADAMAVAAVSSKAEVAIDKAPQTQVAEIQESAPVEVVSSVVPKVEDIRKGITMGDRFLFQRELFGNNGELMNKTIDALNKLDSLEEAMAYTRQKFPNWNKESNAYELFTNLLKRRW